MEADKINREQQKKVHAFIAEIARNQAVSAALMREQLKSRFQEAMDYRRRFSLSLEVCTVREYDEFMAFLVDIALEFGVISESITDYYDDIEQYVAMCIKHRVCCVTGQKHDPLTGYTVDIHHVDKVGMGNDRTKVDHSKLRRMPLTREMHQLSHVIGEEEFTNKFHVVGVLTHYRSGKNAIDDELDIKEAEENGKE